MNTRRSPLGESPQRPPNPDFSLVTDLFKLGVKGKDLARWAEENAVEIPPTLYDAMPVGERGVMARVGGDEIILECPRGAPQCSGLEAAMARPRPGIYRIEQESATFELAGPFAQGVLAQTCGFDFRQAPLNRTVFTRIAGVSCCVIPRGPTAGVSHRIWVDYTYAPYFSETVGGIIDELRLAAGTHPSEPANTLPTV